MDNARELEALVHHLGEARAAQIADLARSYYGIPRAAYDALAQATQGYGGPYGDATRAMEALEGLMERYPES